MLHDGMLDPGLGRSEQAARDSRREARVPFPAELLVRWFSDLKTQVRYRIIDASEHGFRLRTSLPLPEGMTGIAVKLLPDGRMLEKTIVVVWSREAMVDEQDGARAYEAGLKVL
jgi:hypothetical protein